MRMKNAQKQLSSRNVVIFMKTVLHDKKKTRSKQIIEKKKQIIIEENSKILKKATNKETNRTWRTN